MLVKYPRTPHLPWSEGRDDDDVVVDNFDAFKNRIVVVTEKMDGECTSMYNTAIHARSVDSRDHLSRAWVKTLHGQIKHQIPKGYRICGENAFAKHSILYTSLPTYFFVFGVFDENNMCLSWSETREWVNYLQRFANMPFKTVPVLYQGVWDEQKVKACYTGTSVFGGEQEGYVVRVIDAFSCDTFQQNCVKFVRRGHIKPNDKHWFAREIIPNKLKGTK